MAYKISPLSIAVYILVLFSFLSTASGRMVLIICTEGCGCVTESGIFVDCPFIPSNQVAVVQSRILGNNIYRATRVIPIGTVFDVEIDGEESMKEYCPHAAGFRPRIFKPICFSRPEKVRISPNTTSTGLTNCRNSKECSDLAEASDPEFQFIKPLLRRSFGAPFSLKGCHAQQI